MSEVKCIESELKFFKNLNVAKINKEVYTKHALSKGVCICNKKIADVVIKLYKACVNGDIEKANLYRNKLVEYMSAKVASCHKKIENDKNKNKKVVKKSKSKSKSIPSYSMNGGYKM